ncbi:potassium channel family protein [Brachybacterium sp. GCM10030252]|uniref:potassium channel family protein n=1 Tax=Brachybacterium sp. GCM10030252 TaxID=3273380 RepID=UPI0036201962
MTALSMLAGIALVLVGLFDMFHTLLHPRGKGRLSHAVIVAFWKGSAALGHRFGSAVGPGGMVAVIILWVLLQGVGWALIYAPHLPEVFSYSGVDPAQQGALTEPLYVAFMTLSTLGYGDVVPNADWVRVIAPLEALTGFALLTAAMTWFMQVHPALARRRTLALRLAALADAEYAAELSQLEPSSAARTLETLTADLAGVCVDLSQHSESYFFQEEDPEQSLARQLPHALELRDAGREAPSADVRATARALSEVISHLAQKIQGFVKVEGEPEEVFRAYADDHARRQRE